MNLLQGEFRVDFLYFVLASVLKLGITLTEVDSKNITEAILCDRNCTDKLSHSVSKLC